MAKAVFAHFVFMHQRSVLKHDSNRGVVQVHLSILNNAAMNLFTRCAALVLIATSLISCKKSDDGSGASASKTWKLGGTTYTVNNYAKASETFEAYDKDGNGVHFSFAAFPAADGSYNVVSGAAGLGPNDVSVLAFGSNSGSSYFSTGNDHIVATVQVINATRLHIVLPDTWVKKAGLDDSLKLSAKLGDL